MIPERPEGGVGEVGKFHVGRGRYFPPTSPWCHQGELGKRISDSAYMSCSANNCTVCSG